MAEQTEQLEKAQPDTGALKLGAFAVQASQKVQLDIDDAPFLMAVEEEPEVEERALPIRMEEPPQEDPAKLKRRKRFAMLGGVAVGLVLVVGLALWYFMTGTPPVEPVQEEVTVIVVPSEKTLAGREEFKIEFAPFLIAQQDEGVVRFFEARFTGITNNKDVVDEVKKKSLLLRDSIYFYLRNRTHDYLVNSANTRTIKEEILDVVNSGLSQGKMEDVLLVNYLLK